VPDDAITPDEEATPEPSGRPFWSGTLSFGLVSVPVDLYPAARSTNIGLRMLSPEGHPLARRYFCPDEDQPLDAEQIVRGYELEDGSYVVVTDEELAALDPKKSRDIDLRLFVPESELDPIYFDRPYVLASASESPKAYRLLAEIMEREQRAGIATFVMREKEYLIAILSRGGILRAETLRFAEELRPAEIESAPQKPRTDLVHAFAKAIGALSAKKLDDSLLADPEHEALAGLIEEKRRHKRDVIEAPEGVAAPDAEVIDLMEVLRRSLPGGKQAEASKSEKASKASKASSGQRPKREAAHPRARKKAAKR
jgi:DNA end-binding protein Ku